jgi:pilus assembly protein CpaF
VGIYDTLEGGSAFSFGDSAPPQAPENPAAPPPALDQGLGAAAAITISPAARAVARKVLTAFEEMAAAARREGRSFSEEERAAILNDLLRVQLPGLAIRDEEAKAALAEAVGGLFGIERFLDDPDVSDVLVNAHDRIFVERKGKLEQVTEPLLASADEFRLLIDRIIARCPERAGLTRETPRFDSRFVHQAPYGPANVRVNATDSSVSVSEEPTLSLRKPTESGFDKLEPWTQGDEPPLSPSAAYFLREAFRRRASVLIVGGTGSGKTSLLKGLLRSIADLDERVVVIEEANELDLSEEIDDYVGLVANQNIELGDLVRNAMRMRPDRIVVGECREAEEVMGFLRAVNTGHPGSITTVHATSARDGLQALLTLGGSATKSKTSVDHIGSLIARGLDIVVFLNAQYRRDADGSRRRVRRVLEIFAVGDFSPRDGVPDFEMVPIFLRAAEGAHASVEFDLPLASKGYGALADRGAHIADRMRSAGVGDEELRSWLDPRTSLPPVEPV